MDSLTLNAPNGVAAPRVAASCSFTPASSPSPSPCAPARAPPTQGCNTTSPSSSSPSSALGGGAAVEFDEVATLRRRLERERAARRTTEIEGLIDTAETELVALDEQLFAEAGNYDRARALSAERDATQERIDALTTEWETLLELLEAEEEA